MTNNVERIQPKIQQRPQPPPSPSLSLREKMGSLKRMITPGNRPLPPTPPDQRSKGMLNTSFILLITNLIKYIEYFFFIIQNPK